jgi:hypothetical protein
MTTSAAAGARARERPCMRAREPARGRAVRCARQCVAREGARLARPPASRLPAARRHSLRTHARAHVNRHTLTLARPPARAGARTRANAQEQRESDASRARSAAQRSAAPGVPVGLRPPLSCFCSFLAFAAFLTHCGAPDAPDRSGQRRHRRATKKLPRNFRPLFLRANYLGSTAERNPGGLPGSVTETRFERESVCIYIYTV